MTHCTAEVFKKRTLPFRDLKLKFLLSNQMREVYALNSYILKMIIDKHKENKDNGIERT